MLRQEKGYTLFRKGIQERKMKINQKKKREITMP
jgi:hypothetical protein